MSAELDNTYRVSWLTGPWVAGSISMRLRSFATMKEALGFAFERLDDPKAHNPILSQIGRARHLNHEALLQLRLETTSADAGRSKALPRA
jgi:hypothetical protein